MANSYHHDAKMSAHRAPYFPCILFPNSGSGWRRYSDWPYSRRALAAAAWALKGQLPVDIQGGIFPVSLIIAAVWFFAAFTSFWPLAGLINPGCESVSR